MCKTPYPGHATSQPQESLLKLQHSHHKGYATQSLQHKVSDGKVKVSSMNHRTENNLSNKLIVEPVIRVENCSSTDNSELSLGFYLSERALGRNLTTHTWHIGEIGKSRGETSFLAIFFGALRPGWRQPHNYITGIFLHHRRYHAQQKPLLVVPECGIFWRHNTLIWVLSLFLFKTLL